MLCSKQPTLFIFLQQGADFKKDAKRLFKIRVGGTLYTLIGS